ncbi:MAG: 3-methylcrotonyl-CoA carboxylase [Halioglobus sp.]|nr:3-methylcrotonyl-CoA carboxylase [Halioglobus sp.]
MFSKILIANRGEIACRVIRTAQRLGVRTVAVYSDADAEAQHVRQADEAVYIGAAPARESYLDGARILQAALTTGAEAVHPGYGFLSENAAFARDCAQRGLVFIGPPAAAIEAMGSKSAAKRIMEDAGVPLLPGYHGQDQADAVLREAADAMGYPVLLKAVSGGGGKGMRQVDAAQDFGAALEAARREASASFGDDAMLVEKFLQGPRHVEVQVFFDEHGDGVYLAERDCSVQRRHQKVIEEAPAPGLSPALRQAMGEAALRAGQAIDYRGAGTVEFLLDADGQFYFMEMNTRLQVEHPVTEMITGQDLVEWQLRVACGEPLPLRQEQVALHGHAFEARIYAEDPENDFLPVTGTLSFLRPPDESRHVRVDTGVQQGDEISVYYDPMIAKLIVWDESRERALQRLAGALAAYRIGGTTTNVEFLYNLATSAPFVAAQLDTGFIREHHALLFHDDRPQRDRDLPRAALALLLHRRAHAPYRCDSDPHSPWQAGNAWRLNEPHRYRLQLSCNGQEHTVDIESQGEYYRVSCAGREVLLRGWLTGDTLQLEQDGHRQRGTLAQTAEGFTLYLDDGACHFAELPADTGEQAGGDTDARLAAPMNGTVVELLVDAGAAVAEGEPLMVLEAMKMEHTIRAPAAGTVSGFHYRPGDLVDGGAELLDFEARG